MWTEFIFVGLFVLRCAVSSSPPKPTNVSFSSVNLRNVLHWFPGNGTPDGTHFTVEYAIYGNYTAVSKGKREHWRAVHHCTNIVRTWCDLSAETWAEEEGYYARVRALGRKSSSKWTVTKRRFDPKGDTIFGPPLISVEIENNSAIVTLRGPMRFSPNNHTPPLSMKAIYPHMSYNLSIYNTHRNHMYHFPVETSLFKYQLLDYNTEYCFFAKSRFLSIPVQCKHSARHCITTPQDPVIEQLQRVVVGIVVPSLCICIIVLVSYLLYNYLSGVGQTIPHPINRLSFYSCNILLPPENDTMTAKTAIIEILGISLSVPHDDQRPYIHQGPEEPRDDSSIDYSTVLQATEKTNGGEKYTRAMKHEKGDAVNSLTGELPKCADSYKKKDVNSKEDTFSGGYKPQARRLGPLPVQTEGSALLQTFPQSQGNFVLLSQTRDPMQSNPRSVSDKQSIENTETEEREEKQNEFENVPLLSEYSPQSTPTKPNIHSQQSNCLSGDYGALFPAEAKQAEAGNNNDEMETESKCRIPESMELVLAGMEITLNKEEIVVGMQPSDREIEDKIAGNCEGMYMTRSQLKLESVFLKQMSDEEAGAHLDKETGSEIDHVFSKWELVFSGKTIKN